MPRLTQDIALRYGLIHLKPLEGLSHYYVLFANQGHRLIVVKLGLDLGSLKHKAQTLQAFTGKASVIMPAQEDNLLLLQAANSGISLKSYSPSREREAFALVSELMQTLHQAPLLSFTQFPHIKDRLLPIDRTWSIVLPYLQSARTLKQQLLAILAAKVLLHGDLHHDNILQNHLNTNTLTQQTSWLAIDIKGVIEEPAYEVAALIRNPMPELLHQPNVSLLIEQRVAFFTQTLQLPVQRIYLADMCPWIYQYEQGI